MTAVEQRGSGLHSFAPIGLAELEQSAALLTRVDRKYVVPLDTLVPLLTGLANSARVLEIDGARGFDYSSLYFDTAERVSYLLAARNRRHRFKVRRRTYLATGTSYLEVKFRGPRSTTIKERVPDADGPEHAAPVRCGEFVDGALLRSGVDGVTGRDLRPVLRTGYRRCTLYLPEGNSRVTVDTGLTWSLPQGPELELPGLAIVETKSPAAASAADRLLWALGHRPARISKYCTGLAAFDADLPSNKWHPVLRRLSVTQADGTAA